MQRAGSGRVGPGRAGSGRLGAGQVGPGGLRGDEDLAALVARLGYADQSHFTHDVRTATGSTPGQLARRWREG